MSMNKQRINHWEAMYEQSAHVWDERPDPMLVEYAALIPPGDVLDLGIGEGRNAFFLAHNGYTVRGIDIAPSAVERCNAQAKREQLAIEVEVGNILDSKIPHSQYALIASTMTLQFMKASESQLIFERMKQGLAPGGVIYLTVFSTDDPGYGRFAQQGKAIEPHTYYSKSLEQHVHFFTKDELLTAFTDLKLIYIAEQISYDPGHGGAPDPHYHGILTYMGKQS